MKSFVVLTIALICGLVHAEDKYPYPMNIPVSISASFAELRANHFHAGLDMSTQGVIGIEVHSVADGYVSRIKVSPYGYGHALYITHPDGHTTLYGHLSAYVGEIDSVVRKEQYKKQSFEFDLMLKEGQLPVKKGQVVALSGNTGGSGGPHLHFEVRDTKTEETLNPLEFLIPITDTQAPVAYGIKVFGMTDSAQVAGRCQDRYYALADIEGKSINVAGEIGLGMHAVDYFIAGHRPCGVTGIKLYDGEKLMFRSDLERISFDETRYINSHIDFAERQTNKRFVQKSFVEPNNKLNHTYKTHERLVVKEGEVHKMKYILNDYNGNTRVVSFTLVGKTNVQATKRTHKGDRVDWGKTWAKDTLGISVIIPREALYKDEYIEISSLQLNNDNAIYKVGNEGIPLQKAFTISIPIDSEMQKLGRKLFIGQVDSKSKQTYIGGSIEGNNIVAHSKTLGSFALGVDSIAPKIKTKNTRTNLKPSNSIMIGISDDMSGIKKYNVYIDGKWECFEYDYKNARLVTTVGRLGLKAGNHDLKAVVEDAAGNIAQWEWKFSVIAQ
ncbi:MAG: M23 family metallopeptidase [Bacteroidales bacterium]|nr:M23 family metallopeptidase [Bacteroidales bacterium]